MYNVSQAFKNASKSQAQEHRLTGTVGNVSFDESNVFEGSFNIQKQCTDSGGIVLGSAYIGQLTATFTGLNISRGSWVGKIITPSFGLKVGNSWEDVPLGSYKIKEVVHTAEGTQVTAYDNMAKFDKVIKHKKATIGFVTDSMYDFVSICCEKCHVILATTKAEIDALPNGYRQQGDIEIYGDAGDNDFANDIETYRDLLYWCCQTMGAYATMNRYNQLVIRPYTQTVVEEINDTVRLSGAHFEDYVTHFTGIYVTDMDTNDEVYYGYDASELTTQLEETAADITDINEALSDNADAQAELERKHEAHEITDEEYAQQKAELVAEAKDLRSDKKKLEKRLGWLEQELQKAQDDDEGATLDLGANPFLQYENITKRDNTRRRVLNALANISYTPFTCPLVCGAHYDLGDVIHFTGGHASDDYCCVMSWSYTHNQGTELEGFGTDTDEHARRVKDRARKDAHAAGSTAANTGHTFVAEDSQSTETGAPRTGKSGDVWMQTDVTHTYTSRYPIEFSTAYEDRRDTRVVDAKDRCETTEQGYWNVGVAGSIDWSEGSAHYNFNKGVPIYAVHITEPGTYKWHCKIMYTSTFDPQYASTSKFAGFVLYPNDNTTGPDQCVPPSDIVCPPDSVWHDNNTDCDMGANVSLEPGIHEYSGEIIFDSTTFPTGECYLWLFFYRACTVYRTPQVESMECTFALALNDFYFEKVTNPSTGETDGGVIDTPADVLKDIKYNQNGTWKSVEYIAKAEADDSETAGGAEWNGVNVVTSTENKNVKFSLKKNVMRAWYKADPPQTQRNFSQFCVRYTGEPDKSLEIASHADHTWANIDIKTDDENAFKIKSGGVGGSGKYCSYVITGLTVGTRYYFNFAANFSDNATFGDDVTKGLGLVFNTTGEIATDAWAGAPDTFNEETLYYSMRRDTTKHYADFDFEATATTMYMCVVTADVTSAEEISLTLSEFVISKSERKLIRNLYLYDYEKNTWLKYKPFGGTVGSGGDSGGSVVEITPTLSAGTKIADYSIDGATGALYAPNGGSGGTQAIELTKAQYDALSPEEKADTSKVYYIKDYPTSSRLANLDDVNLTSPVDGQILKYQDEEWINVTLTKNMVGLGNVPNVTTDNQTPTVTEASTRANLATGDTLKIIIGKIKKFFADLKTVAFTGAYSDLTGTPTIPSVGNGTITIQKNGTMVNTFTANQSSNKTVNITMSKNDVGLGNVDNTSDLNKPISTATAAAIAGSKTASGSVVTVNDAAPIYAEQVDVAVVATQTGSGTPSPSNIRPISGYTKVDVNKCGKNLFDGVLTNGIVNTGGSYSTAATRVTNVSQTVDSKLKLTSGSYTISSTTLNDCTVVIKSDSGAVLQDLAASWHSLPYTFTVNQDGYLYFTCRKTNNPSINMDGQIIQVEEGSTATTYEPYNGQTVSLQLGNKNLLPMTVEGIKAANTTGTWSGNVYSRNNVSFTFNTDANGLITSVKVNSNGAASGNAFVTLAQKSDGFTIQANTSYILSGCPSGGSNSTYRLSITDSVTNTYVDDGSSKTFTPNSTFVGYNYQVQIYVFSGQTVSNKVFYPMLRSASITDSTFSPYNPTLGGMVYSGQLTLNDDGSAVFVGDRAEVDLGSMTYTLSQSYSGVFYATMPTYKMNGNMISSCYEFLGGTNGGTGSMANVSTGTFKASNYGSNYEIYIKDTRYSDAASFKTGITGQQLVYELATPFTIHLSAEQLQLLQGTNNLWSNAGDVTLKYQPDNVIAEPKADVQRLRDDVDDRLVGNACRNLFNKNGTQTTTYGTATIDGEKITCTGTYYARIALDLPADIYTVSCKVLSFSVTRGIRLFYEDNTYSDTIIREGTINTNGKRIIAVLLYCGIGTSATTVYQNVQIERGSSPTAYEEYYPSNRELWEMIKQGLPVTILDDVAVSGSSTQYTIPDISQYTMVQCVLTTCPAPRVAYVRDTKTIPVSVLLHNITAYTYNHIITLLAIDPSTANAWTECRIEMNSTTQISVKSDSGASGIESPRLSIIAW